ncbi:MAG: chitobiase/beta-hexosaminidase C-terminal domain-containing protein, partial [Kiritimatiellae bacterium]|nr:chitobiase/beta-hexosaminidase C-terminal domain-containing protein [Kiritimatiellia bacterium]
NMGCGHSDRQGNISGPGCFPYSCGYHFVDAAGTRRYTVMGYSYTSPASGEYLPVPYFSSPDITSDELGVVVGTPTNDNRQTILRNCEGASTWREHVVPYDWDVRFLDDNGNDIPDATYFSPRLYVTLTHANPSASIYYTLDGSMPTSSSACCAPGTRLTLVDTRTITACAVVDGIAQSFRTVTFNEGHSWSGEPGQNGSGVWMDDDQSVLSWNDSTTYFYSYLDSVVFPDLAQNAAPTVTVKGVVAPVGAAFPATKTAYTFEKGTSDAMIHLHDARFAPSGDLTFNVPVKLDAVAFTNPANHTITFNAPFGQAVTDTSGYCTNMIGIGASGTLVVSPGAGCTQTFDFFSNVSWFYNNAQICVGDGAVVFKGPSHASNGLFGSTRLLIGSGGLVVFDTAGRIAKSGAAISGEGTAVCKSLATAGSMNWRVSGWEGTVHLTNVAAATLPLDLYGWRGSTVRLTGVSGYPGASGNTNIIFDTNIELVDAADGTAALTVNNGYSTDGTSILRLCGGGTFRTTLSPSRTYVRQGFVVGDASDFTGSLDIVGSQFTFGSTIRKGDNSQSGTIYVDAGHSVTNAPGAAWSAPNLVVNGELVKKGRLEILNSVTFGDGASLVVDALPADGVVLTSSAVTTNGALKVAVLGDDRPYVAAIVANGDSTVSLVFRNVPLPATVNASITVRHWGGDGWEDRVLGFDLPTGWVTNYYPPLDTAEAVAAKYDGVAANGAKVWQCYMLGLDPTDAASNVSLSMAVVGSKIRFSVEGLGETHALDGIRVEWRLKTSTDLAADPAFQNYREYTDDFPPTFMEHEMPDKPTDRASEPAADTLFYKLVVTFVAD